jgi:hypothetical protein
MAYPAPPHINGIDFSLCLWGDAVTGTTASPLSFATRRRGRPMAYLTAG